MLFDQIVSRIPLSKGWSADRKYRAESATGEIWLLRISDLQRKEAVEACFYRMQQLEKLGIPMCRALEFGVCPEGVYVIHSWVSGSDAETIVPFLSPIRQYEYGLRSGRILKLIHSIPAPAEIPAWVDRYGAKIDRKDRMYRQCPLQYDVDGPMLACVAENRKFIESRPQSYQHGDYHIGNMMIDDKGELIIIDFEKEDFGDPWEEFNRIVWSVQASEYFASGMVDGYFENNVPNDFWCLLALYICNNSLGSLPWQSPLVKRK